MLSETRVVAFRYLSGHELLVRTADTSEFTGSNGLIDSQDNTCVPVMTESGKKLQAAFDFPRANISREMSVNIVVENANDCTSMMWTWWVYRFRGIQTSIRIYTPHLSYIYEMAQVGACTWYISLAYTL